ncbi:MAG: rod-binding protein [Roseomonas sp.]|nr:rod-binding protein [Roseomonas sp.]MCA3327823.1 rod-binding protein [Roseomonas sp.]MCA3329629.1 rod-binding protein [Roseomonas sp.]MCA3334514.1 rod-binding protein [Roseomonas sp.]MCA3348188.1 rod-binding protein [Roseomonas sp.]
MLDATNLAAPQQRAIRPPLAGAGSEASLRKSARDFEAQALGFLLQPMFATVDMSKSSFGGGAAEAQWRPMLVEAFAASAVRAGGVGIADAVYRELLRNRGAQTPETVGTQP